MDYCVPERFRDGSDWEEEVYVEEEVVYADLEEEELDEEEELVESWTPRLR